MTEQTKDQRGEPVKAPPKSERELTPHDLNEHRKKAQYAEREKQDKALSKAQKALNEAFGDRPNGKPETRRMRNRLKAQ